MMDSEHEEGDDRKKQFKKTFTPEELQSRRIKEYDELRRDRRERNLSKRRRENDATDVQLPAMDEEEMKKLLHVLQRPQNSLSKKLETLKKLRCSLNCEEPPLEFLLANGLVNTLMELLLQPNEEIQLEAAWAITNMACGSHDQTTQVAATSPILIAHLSGSNPILQEQCAWALGNLAGDSMEIRDLVRANGAMRPMVHLLASKKETLVWTAVWALCNMVRGPNPRFDELYDAGVMAQIPALLSYQSVEDPLLPELCWLCTFLSAANISHLPELLALQIPFRMVEILLAASNAQLLIPALRTLGNIVSAPNEFAAVVVQVPGFYEALCKCLTFDHRGLRKEATWVVSNVAGSSPEYCDRLVELGFVTILVNMFSYAQFDIKREVAYALANIAADGRHACAIVDAGAVRPFMQLLYARDPDVAAVTMNFVGLILAGHPQGRRLVEEAGGVDALEQLVFYENPQLRQQASLLLDRFFGEEELVDEGDQGIDEEQEQYPPWRKPRS